jgi:hypothetical protein
MSIDDERIYRIKRQHVPYVYLRFDLATGVRNEITTCAECGDTWPCDAGVLLELLTEIAQAVVK